MKKNTGHAKARPAGNGTNPPAAEAVARLGARSAIEDAKAVKSLLDESEFRFRSLVEMMPDSILVYDESGQVIFANEQARLLFRAESVDDLIGMHFSSFVQKEDRFDLNTRFSHMVATGDAVGVAEHVRVGIDGTRIPVETNAAPIQWFGRPAVLAILRDVSTRYEVLAMVRRSEARARAIMDNVADGVIIIDEDGIVRNFNQSAERMFGYEARDIVGQDANRLIPSDPGAPASFIERCLAPGADRGACQIGRELICRRRNGSLFPSEATISETVIDDERIFIGALRDISDRKADERALRESEERFRLAFETAPHGMALAAPDGRWIQVNRALCDLLGYSREELLEQDFQSLTHSEDLEVSLALVRRLTAGRIATYQQEKRYVHKDGGSVWVLQSVSLMRDGDGNPLHLIKQVFDLSALKQADAERSRLESQLRHAQKLESLGTLSGGIAHEFNNLLQPVTGLLEMSLDAVEDRPDVYENLVKALENARRSALLVEKILSFSHIDNAEMRLTDMAPAVDETVTLLSMTLPSTLQIESDLKDIGASYVDRTQISQVIMNLGVNAMHAVGDAVGRLAFSLTSETITERRAVAGGVLEPGEYARLAVTDTGCGMTAETIERIFEPFFTTKPVGRGTGMGLASVHGIVSRHGGAIDVQSTLGVGSTFIVYIPILREAPDAAADGAAAALRLAEAQ